MLKRLLSVMMLTVGLPVLMSPIATEAPDENNGVDLVDLNVIWYNSGRLLSAAVLEAQQLPSNDCGTFNCDSHPDRANIEGGTDTNHDTDPWCTGGRNCNDVRTPVVSTDRSPEQQQSKDRRDWEITVTCGGDTGVDC